MDYEYKCVGAPERPRKSRRAKTGSQRLAVSMEEIIQEEAVKGWEYYRTDLVPVTEKSSWLGRAQEVHRAVLVFRRELENRRGRAAGQSRRGADEFDGYEEAVPTRRGRGAAPADDTFETPQPRRRAVRREEPEQEFLEPVSEAPKRERARPAEEPIRLSAEEAEEPRPRFGRSRSTPSGLG